MYSISDCNKAKVQTGQLNILYHFVTSWCNIRTLIAQFLFFFLNKQPEIDSGTLRPCSCTGLHAVYLQVVCVWPFDHPSCTAACLEGFTQDLPRQDQWSQFSTSSISPDSEVVFPSVRFTCNGTLEALNIPIALRGSDYLFWDRNLRLDLTVWRQSKAHIVRIESERAFERIDNKGLEMVDTQTGQTLMLNSSDVLQFTETVDISIDIMKNDTMGAIVPRTMSRMLNITGTMKEIIVADHLPLLFHRDTQIPLISANFIPSTSTTDEG